MIDKKSIIKMSEQVFRKSKNYPDRRIMHPKREWGTGVVVFVIITIIGSVAVGNVFVTYKNTNEIDGVSSDVVPKYRDVIVQDALDVYHVRVDEHNALRKDVPLVVEEVVVATSTIDVGVDEVID